MELEACGPAVVVAGGSAAVVGLNTDGSAAVVELKTGGSAAVVELNTGTSDNVETMSATVAKVGAVVGLGVAGIKYVVT